jgi:hypothetical protein
MLTMNSVPNNTANVMAAIKPISILFSPVPGLTGGEA